ncbi:3-(3-hydroxy-phenyl)propionate/3-hydroxycinnamic acid hydroxylase [Pigmentiphaga humi]|uniref:3-(3-hydroxy-phenyl)propionate/3-hydroxycinnamic acid hydroxylase n=1 Tax=Pigmentiphaga humi TaxID=2478468 RepID=A0A3P4B4F7_9BURK|nr:FAD-dependent oxidoreductase [Pigmentiphaga humi]VCU70518.1 3-(3-hydroxy-phenyl)propionate/3-hydroxycinnamic acid hydroxylase [Pigmentiphaga humi]
MSASRYELPVYPFHRPAELDGAQLRHPVVVIGAGLAGLTMAADLSLRGIPVIVLDDDDTVGVRGASSRGICYAQRSLEIFDRLGIAGRILEKGVTWSIARTLSGRDTLYTLDLARQSASRMPPFVNIQQFYVEWYLVDRLAELGNAEIRWKNRVTGIDCRADHSVLTVDTPEGRYRMQAEWVIDAEGVHSTVRESLGLPLDKELGSDRWCITDVRFRQDPAAERWTWVDAPFNEGRAVWRHLMADSVWRLDFQMDPDSDPKEVSRHEVAEQRVRAMLGPDADFEIVWVGPYAYRTQLLKEFRHRRVFFIGDAAHVTSPFGARGGNSGIQDADNLAWKLAQVINSRCNENLLDSYCEERRAAAEANIRITRRSGRFIRPQSRAEHVLRQAVLDLSRRFPFAQALLNTGRLCTPHDYAGMSRLGTGAYAGRAMPDFTLQGKSGPTSLTAVLREAGNRLLLLANDTGPAACRYLRTLESELPVRVAFVAGSEGELQDPHDYLSALVGARAGQVAVIRPDSHLAGVAADPGHAASLVRHALAFPTPSSPETP